MPRYVAFLRGVSPMNAKMPELKRCFESAGFTDVRTVLASGNVVFNARATSESKLERKVETAMSKELDRTFHTIVRSVVGLQDMLQADPYARFRLAANAKRVVTFLHEPAKTKLSLPLTLKGARILAMTDREVFTAYVPQPGDPVFMRLIERTFGTNITTRTLDTVRKCVAA